MSRSSNNPDNMNDEQFLEYYKGHMFAYAQVIGSDGFLELDTTPTAEQIKKFARRHGDRYDEIVNQSGD